MAAASAQYRAERLQGVSFAVGSGEKVGIVGRTGSGKSSLIVALFRLAEPHQGAIVLDGFNLLDMGLQARPWPARCPVLFWYPLHRCNRSDCLWPKTRHGCLDVPPQAAQDMGLMSPLQAGHGLLGGLRLAVSPLHCTWFALGYLY